jgi:hypothetical protein
MDRERTRPSFEASEHFTSAGMLMRYGSNTSLDRVDTGPGVGASVAPSGTQPGATSPRDATGKFVRERGSTIAE